MCDVLLPPGVNQISVKYIHISYHIIPYHIIKYIMSYYIIYHVVSYRTISCHHIIPYNNDPNWYFIVKCSQPWHCSYPYVFKSIRDNRCLLKKTVVFHSKVSLNLRYWKQELLFISKILNESFTFQKRAFYSGLKCRTVKLHNALHLGLIPRTPNCTSFPSPTPPRPFTTSLAT
jgi:hypothetical protein